MENKNLNEAEKPALNKGDDSSSLLTDELDLCDPDIAELYRNQQGWFKGTALLAQLVRELKILNSKKQ
jgi:hypothetical protein